MQKKIIRSLDPLSPPFFFLLFSSLNFIFVYLYVLVSRLLQRDLPILSRLDLSNGDFTYAFFVFLAYAFSWLVAYSLVGKRIKRKKTVECVMRGKRLSPSLIYLLLGMGVSFFLAMFYNHPARGLIQAGRSGLTSGLYGKVFFLVIALVLALYPISICSYLMFRMRNPDKKSKKVIAKGVLLIFFTVSSLILAFALIQLEGKSRALFPFIITLILWHYYVNRVSFTAFLVTILGTISFALVIDAAFLGAKFSISSNPFDSLFGLDANIRTFDGLYNLAKLVSHSNKSEGFTFFLGNTMFADFMSDLGVQTGVTSRTYLMNIVYGFPDDIKFSFPISKPGEFFLNFGWIGVIIGGGLLGGISRWCYFFLVEGRALSGASIPVYITLIYSLGIATPIGYFSQALIFNMVSVFMLVVLWFSLQGGFLYSWKEYK